MASDKHSPSVAETTPTSASADESQKKSISARDAWYPPKQRDFYVLKELVSKDFKLKYRRSVLGVAWSVLNPLLMMIVMTVVFSTFLGAKDPTISNYSLYLILGNTAFSLMSDSTSQGLRSIIDASSLLKKVKVNRIVFPVQKVLSALVNYGFSLIAVAIVMIYFQTPLSWWILLLPVAVALLALFSVGLSLLLSAATVFFRDVIHLWSVVLTAWTYATPLFYSTNMLSDWMVSFENFNPMYIYVTFIRDILLYQQCPAMRTIVAAVLFAVVSLAIGYAVFHHNEHKFILYI
ncbi:MAG: ABC transporter permease [Tractidigestivibacter sp.]|uniref:ABC transporter permease n=1 Tax=Tractidigestivibacter sp. TaxID=2847320 RepID=UPI003D89C979